MTHSIYLRVDRRTRSRERYIEVGLESVLATTKPRPRALPYAKSWLTSGKINFIGFPNFIIVVPINLHLGTGGDK